MSDATIRNLQKIDRRIMQSFEAEIRKIMAKYSLGKMPKVDTDALLKGRVSFLCKVADAISKLSNTDATAAGTGDDEGSVNHKDVWDKIRAGETKLRDILTNSGYTCLPDRVLWLSE